MSVVPEKPHRRLIGRAPNYGDKPFLTLKLCYGGKFIYSPRRTYEGGDVLLIDYVRPGSLSISDLDKILQECGLEGITLLYLDEEWKLCERKENLDALMKYSIDKGCNQVVLYCDYVPIEFSCWGSWIAQDYKILGEPPVELSKVAKCQKIGSFISINCARKTLEDATVLIENAIAHIESANAPLYAPQSQLSQPTKRGKKRRFMSKNCVCKALEDATVLLQNVDAYLESANAPLFDPPSQ